MPAPTNPYRQREALAAEAERFHLLPEAADLRGRPPEGPEAIGLSAFDIDAVAQRNYRLGRMHATREREGRIAELVADLNRKPAQAYDEGYEKGLDDAERDALDQIIALLGPARVIADEIKYGLGRRLTPKQREERCAELVGYVIATTNLLHSLEPLIEDGERDTVNDARTLDGLKRLREYVKANGETF